MRHATYSIDVPEEMKLDIDEIIALDGFVDYDDFFTKLVLADLKRRRELRLEKPLIEESN